MDVANSPESDVPAIEFPVSDGAPLTVPPWLRRRLTELNAYSFPSSIEEIEAKLHNADLRRQKFYENLSSKAQLKRRSFKAADDCNLAQRLEAKLQAAEQKRIQILKAHSQRRATLREKTSQSLLRTISFRGKYNQKHATAENNWLELLEAEKKREHDWCLQVKKEAKPASQAKKQRADHLLQNLSLHNVVGVNCNMKTQRQADNLSKKLLRCWRKFIKHRTTLNLAKSYYVLNINASHGKSMPFEHFAFLIDKSSTLQTTKALLDRLETRYKALLDVSSGTNLDDISHLLTGVVSPNNRHVKVVSPRAITKTSVRLSRYQPRVVLSAYMVLDHPDTVFSGQGVRETALVNSAKKFIQEFELLVGIILNGPSKTSGEGSSPSLATHCTFRSQLAAFDAAWCSYLNSFVIWKVKDVESLEQDLVKAACQMEISMIRRYKPAPNQADSALTHDMKALQKQIQVTEHQKLLEEKIMHLSGEAGIERLQDALSETRKQYFKSKENSMLVISPVTQPPSCLATSPSIASLHDESNSVVTSQFGDDASAPPFEHLGSSVASTSGLVNHSGERLGMENVLIVNEFLHGRHYSVTDSSNISDENQKLRGTMEKAFWDGIFESIQQENYDHVIVLMKEVRDELCEMSPKSGKQEILEAIDLDILSQLLGSCRLDMEYLGTIMEFALVRLQNLSAVAHENQLKVSYQKIIAELVELCHAGDGSNRSLAIALIKGLRFVLEQIQVLKQEISMALIKILEPLLKGPSGLEYLGKAFTKLYGPPSDALRQLPLTMQWLSFAGPSKDQEWSEHKRMLLELQEDSSLERHALPSTALRTGGHFLSKSQTSPNMSLTNTTVDDGYTECKGEKGDLLVRLGLVKLVSDANGVIPEELPETLKLNFLRLRSLQNQLQKIIVIAISILVLRQTLVMEQMISSPEEMESTMGTCSMQLFHILDTVVDAGLEELVEVLSKTTKHFDTANDLTKTESRRLVLARMLRKSVQAEDPVFNRVSQAVYMATRGVVLSGSMSHGRKLAEKALRQVGAVILTNKVMEIAVVLGVMARVSKNVHGPWYAVLIENI